MNKHFQILFFVLASFSVYAQEGQDSIIKKGKKWNAGIFVSGGMNYAQYPSDKFFNYLDNRAGFPVRMNGLYNSSNTSHTAEGGVSPNNVTYNKSVSSYNIGLGLELFSGNTKKIKLHHVFEANYIQLTGEYKSSASYGYEEYNEYTSHKYSIVDTMYAQYAQSQFSFGYKIQPLYSLIFLSFGINTSANRVKLSEKQKDYINGSVGYEYTSVTTFYSRNSSTDTVSKYYFINIPFQFGAGVYIKINRLLFKPAFYFTPYFRKGYNFYNVSLAVGYSFKKK